MANHELFENLLKEIEEGRGVADILKDKSKEEVKEVLLITKKRIGHDTTGYKIYTLLAHAIGQKNATAVNDILKLAKDKGFLEELLTEPSIIYPSKPSAFVHLIQTKVIKEINYKELYNGERIFNALYFAIHEENDQVTHDIVKRAEENGFLKEIVTSEMIAQPVIVNILLDYIKKDDDIVKIMLNCSANDLFKAILNHNEREIDTFYCLLNKPNIARQVFQSGWMRTLCITDKKAQELAEKVSEGKYGEVINTIKTRQALVFGALSAVMMIGGACIFATLPSTITVVTIAFCIGIAAVVIGSVVGILSLGFAMIHGFSKIEVPDHELSTEKQPGHNGSDASEITAEGPDAKVDQINLERTIGEKETSVGNGGVASQPIM